MIRAPAYGLFGKLPAKRDFVAVDIPQAVLVPWETWLQRVVAESRQQLGKAWLDCFLTAPLWHFQSGTGVLGRAVTGVMMPSVDGVGRYFPLVALTCADDKNEWAMPDFADESFTALEMLMLTALDSNVVYDDFLMGLRALPIAAHQQKKSDPVFSASFGDTGDEMRPALRGWAEGSGFSSASLWWTRGGDNFAPRMLAINGLPDGALFSAMLNGNFPSDAAVEEPV